MTQHDWPGVLALNEASVENLSQLDMRRLEWIASLAQRNLVVDEGSQIAAFAIALAPGTRYDSPNYGWFDVRFDEFFYLDRVVVAEQHRRRGFATCLYDVMEREARPYGRTVCDVGVEPPNEASLAFHIGRGYVEVGRKTYARDKVVALLSKTCATVDRFPEAPTHATS